MARKEIWIKEVAQEINRSSASLKRAIKETGTEVNSKYDVLLCYAMWSVPKLKDVENQEARYKKRIKDLEQLIYDLQNVAERMRVDFNEQMESKDRLIDTQNEIIANRDRTLTDKDRTIAEKDTMIDEMEALLRGLPLASGE